MRLTELSLGLLSCLGAVAARSSPYETYAPKITSGSLKLDNKLYQQLTSTPRDYSVAILLTALESKYGCSLCHEFQPEWDILARSWTKGDSTGQSRLLFGTLDVANGRETFQAVRRPVVVG